MLPSDVAGLIIWHETDDQTEGVGNAVATLVGKGGMPDSQTQGDATKRPLLVQRDEGVAIRLDDVNDSITLAASTAINARPLTIFAVYARNAGASAQRRVLSGDNSSTHNWLMGTIAGPIFRCWFGDWLDGGRATLDFHVHCVVQPAAGNASYYVDEILKQSVAATNVPGVITLGVGPFAEPANADLLAIVVYNTEVVPGSADFIGIHDYFRTRFFTPDPITPDLASVAPVGWWVADDAVGGDGTTLASLAARAPATINLTTADASARPTIRRGVVATHDALEFTPNNRMHTVSNVAAGPRTIIVVVKRNVSGSNGDNAYFGMNHTSATITHRVANGDNVLWKEDSGGGSHFFPLGDPYEWVVYSARILTGSEVSTVYRNNRGGGRFTSSSQGVAAALAVIGAATSGSTWALRGQIAEAVVWDVLLSPDETRAIVRSMLLDYEIEADPTTNIQVTQAGVETIYQLPIPKIIITQAGVELIGVCGEPLIRPDLPPGVEQPPSGPVIWLPDDEPTPTDGDFDYIPCRE